MARGSPRQKKKRKKKKLVLHKSNIKGKLLILFPYTESKKTAIIGMQSMKHNRVLPEWCLLNSQLKLENSFH